MVIASHAAGRVRLMLVALTVVVMLAASATTARADRLTAYAGSAGYCNFDNWLDTERNLAGTTYYFGMAIHCFGPVLIPSRWRLPNAYLSTDVGLGWRLTKEAHEECYSADCVAGSSHSSVIDADAKNESDGTIVLFPGGTQKNPNSIKWTGVSDPSRCIIYNGGYSVWCRGLYEEY
jgi:hypothetical protein